jgi:hypothetical protein
MGVGPYLHGFFRVRHMASEDSANFVAGYELQSFLLIVRTDRIVTNVALLWGQMRAMRASSTKEGVR